MARPGAALRCAAAIVVAAAAAAAADRPIRHEHQRLEAGTASWAPLEDRPEAVAGELGGGVRFELERLRLSAERLRFVIAPLEDGGRFLEELAAEAGDEPVVLDTRDTAFERIGLRGLFTAAALHARRAGVEDGLVRLVARFQAPSIAGVVRDRDGGWLPVRARAGELVAEVVGEVRDGRVHAPRLREVRLVGRGEARPELTVRHRRHEIVTVASELRLVLDGAGRLVGLHASRDGTWYGRPLGVER